MSWFGGTDPVSELDAKIEEATSEAIPNGELDIAVGLEITDVIRSKKVAPKQAMRSLKKRVTKVYGNPNLLSSTLKLVDLCVKNGGTHFIAELNTKEFVDYLVDYVFKVHYDMHSYKVYSSEAKYGVGTLILKFIKEWSMYLKDRFNPNYLERHCTLLVKQGYEFPEIDTSVVDVGSNFIDSTAPPDWLDGKECMLCYTPFSVMNRKHHCRACGGVFCQTHSGKSIPLVLLGILQPVRVCDDCYEIHKSKNGRDRDHASEPRSKPAASEEDEQLRRAIELSLQESQAPVIYDAPAAAAPAASKEEEMDADLKAAIEASLRDQNQPSYHTQPQEQNIAPEPYTTESQNYAAKPALEPALDFYLNIMPFDDGAYSTAPSYSRPEALPPVVQPNYVPQKTEPAKPTTEDLTADEEDSINLFIQLMNGIKTDRAKQANIIYDKDLQELNAKVVQLKPKLNRSLRLAIEKYDLFLQMSNKISTITRLYDLFLEAKLHLAYANHHISSPPANYGAGVSQQNTYQPNYPYADTNPYAKYSQQAVSHQSTGGARQSTGASANQSLGSINPSMSSVDQPIGPGSQLHGQEPGAYGRRRPSAPLADYLQELPQPKISVYPTGQQEYAPRRSRVNLQSTPYPIEEGGNYNPGYTSNAPAYPSQPDYDDALSFVPSQPELQSSVPNFAPGASYSQSEFAEQKTGGAYPQQSLYPSEPAYLSDEEASDAESVASRYPPLAGFSDDEDRQPSNEHKEHASARYPAIDVKEDTEPVNDSLPEIKKTPSLDSRKFKAEPEPLIEL